MSCLFVFFYGGPDTVLPVASALAAIGGLLLVLWQRIKTLVTKGFQFLRTRWHHNPSRHSTN